MSTVDQEEENMDTRKIGYWATTGLAAAILTFGGLNEIVHSQRVVETVAHLGYPAFLPSILGPWKLLAVMAILAPRFLRLKEWAYAGIFFDTTGALISHAMAGDGADKLAPPLVVLTLAAASWALRPASRVLGAIDVAKPRTAREVAHSGHATASA
jgi:hypothetical protein